MNIKLKSTDKIYVLPFNIVMNNTNKPKLLFIYANQFGYHTDSYKYCEYLKQDFEISYLCYDQGFEKLFIPDVNIIYMPYNSGKIGRLINFYTFSINLSRREAFDIIFTIHFKLCFIIGLFAKSRIKILDYRTGDLNSITVIRKLKNIIMRFDSLFFKKVCVISEGLRGALYFKKNNTLILPLGADIISEDDHSFARIDLLYVGTLNQRNIGQTIDGYKMFLTKYKEFSERTSYIIIGFGTQQDHDEINFKIKENELENYVTFLGRKKYSDLHQYFSKCNIGVTYVPVTPYFDIQPVTKLFEYLLSGMPVIATNTYQNRLIINSSNGILIKDSPEDFCFGIKKIYERRESFKSSDIRKSVEFNTWENIVNDNLKPYLLSLLI